MPAWDIDPINVQTTLKSTGEAAGGLEKAANSLVSNMASAAESAGTAVPGGQFSGPMVGPVVAGTPRVPVGPVAAALSKYLQERQQKLAYMAQRTIDSVQGAANATNAYVTGDLDMAAEQQANALKATVVPPPPGVGGNGGQGPK
ncbi:MULTISPECIES: DUF6507 family protein [Streptomyces]|jgi:hypothetical protein|uniref:PE family protein n=3 Tax=Streptomyces TaxID=1883 RepID=M3D3F5_9ACTN|nr:MULTISPECIES: DUF6507 family protein [Streptomyces]EMF50657.1 hypothetical protein SBD_8221 [Streptomyces bottropensis ATCC 25435]KND40844.1 hypothetical protein IQ64_32390 [Streptomyces stelliscabiei]MBE1597722.1 hypothetical protein [Streptomyces stelliscabiei]MDX2519949.1 DUF6507 family protein [Streptomyces stelliscabiei]MDX2556738.1 DUF6507 family protein [Streptomyces stelliscabiei]